ncbi:MAG TPA: TonB-dependent receptor, partial [Candidatus Baltobacteraceae bacterium]|nr:TonB-dependent receptor [Candidatus Baltobacteraceae bacterium]
FLRYAVPVHGSDFLIASAIQSLQTFQIPGNADDNETQADTFANLQYHHAGRANGALVYGVAFKRSRIRDFNDPVNDLADGAYTLFSDRTSRDVLLNLDASVTGPRHALKYGASYDASTVQKLYSVTVEPESVYPVAPATVVDNAPNAAHTQAAYVQDSWAMGHDWRLDYGLRADAYELFSTQFVRGFSQVSPRLKITRIYGTRASAYVYAGRFFTPFSFENVSPSAAQELNSQLQPTIAQFDLKPQRDTDVEIGGILPVGAGQLGLRVMQKAAVDLIDDTQVGDTALHQDINYARGNISSQSALYQQTFRHDGRLYVSLTHTRSVNKGCETQLLAPCFGAPQDWTPADHDQKWDGAAGMSLTDAHSGWWSFDAEYGSGLSSAYCEPANDDCKVPPHTTFDVERGIGLNHGLTLTAGVYNVLNDRYLITYLNAQGNHYAAGRTFRVGLRFGER